MIKFEHAGDISELYSFVDENLVYVDAPLLGFLRERDGERLFAFRCDVIVRDHLWHWTLLPANELDADAGSSFERARAQPPATWLSIVEDRRTGSPILSGVWLGARQWWHERFVNG